MAWPGAPVRVKSAQSGDAARHYKKKPPRKFDIPPGVTPVPDMRHTNNEEIHE
jgi:hypothetical protein